MRRFKGETGNLDICVDCLTFLANGEVWDENGEDIAEEHYQRMSERQGGEIGGGEAIDISLGHLDENCELCAEEREARENELTHDSGGWFSWSMCQGCGSFLGGDRYAATYWRGEWEKVEGGER